MLMNGTGVVADIDGAVVECRIRFTSRSPSSLHRSTLMTYIEWSISLYPKVTR
jgi:hypothetical protein